MRNIDRLSSGIYYGRPGSKPETRALKEPPEIWVRNRFVPFYTMKRAKEKGK